MSKPLISLLMMGREHDRRQGEGGEVREIRTRVFLLSTCHIIGWYRREKRMPRCEADSSGLCWLAGWLAALLHSSTTPEQSSFTAARMALRVSSVGALNTLTTPAFGPQISHTRISYDYSTDIWGIYLRSNPLSQSLRLSQNCAKATLCRGLIMSLWWRLA